MREKLSILGVCCVLAACGGGGGGGDGASSGSSGTGAASSSSSSGGGATSSSSSSSSGGAGSSVSWRYGKAGTRVAGVATDTQTSADTHVLAIDGLSLSYKLSGGLLTNPSGYQLSGASGQATASDLAFQLCSVSGGSNRALYNVFSTTSITELTSAQLSEIAGKTFYYRRDCQASFSRAGSSWLRINANLTVNGYDARDATSWTASAEEAKAYFSDAGRKDPDGTFWGRLYRVSANGNNYYFISDSSLETGSVPYTTLGIDETLVKP